MVHHIPILTILLLDLLLRLVSAVIQLGCLVDTHHLPQAARDPLVTVLVGGGNLSTTGSVENNR